MSKKITIRMPKAKLKKWLHALRRGGYKKETGVLYNPHHYSFCCLGVLQHCLSGGYVEVEFGSETYRGLPSDSWLKAEGIQFLNKCGNLMVAPYLPRYDENAVFVNDNLGASFKEIADAIEDCAEGY